MNLNLKLSKKNIYIIGATLSLLILSSIFGSSSDTFLDQFVFEKVDRGTINQEVSASGTIQPKNVVSVGTQISGIVEKVYIDYNQEVKKGQVLAEIDKSLLVQTFNANKAALEFAKSKYSVSQINLKRNEDLFANHYIARADLEKSQIDFESAKAEYNAALSDFNKSQKNLSYAKITSPISGTIISKEIESGQTVAASFQTPTLFKIAEDLRKMQIETNISEADIGLIKKNMAVSFTVDTFPADNFTGTIDQIRLNPTSEQNIIMYTVIIGIDNKDKKLLPGMTAFVNIAIAKKDNILRIPNTLANFKPSEDFKKLIKGEIPKNLKYNEMVLYTLEKHNVIAHKVLRGISDFSFTEIDGLPEGTKIITDFKTTKKGRK